MAALPTGDLQARLALWRRKNGDRSYAAFGWLRRCPIPGQIGLLKAVPSILGPLSSFSLLISAWSNQGVKRRQRSKRPTFSDMKGGLESGYSLPMEARCTRRAILPLIMRAKKEFPSTQNARLERCHHDTTLLRACAKISGRNHRLRRMRDTHWMDQGDPEQSRRRGGLGTEKTPGRPYTQPGSCDGPEVLLSAAVPIPTRAAGRHSPRCGLVTSRRSTLGKPLPQDFPTTHTTDNVQAKGTLRTRPQLCLGGT